MSMYNDTDWGRKDIEQLVDRILQVLPQMPEALLKSIGHSSELDLKENGMLHSPTNQMVRGTGPLNE